MNIRRLFASTKSESEAGTAPAEKPAAGSGSSSRSLASYYRLALVAVTAVMLILGGLLIYHSHHLRQDSIRFEAATKAQSVAARLYGWGSQQRALIRAIADDPELARMFRERDSQGLAERARVLAPLFPGALGLELLPVKAVGAGAKGSEELGYAALDLLRAAESGERVPPLEVHRFGTPEAHIALASRVPASGEGPALGLIMVRLGLSRLRQQLGLQGDFPGALILEQRPTGSSSLKLAAIGQEQDRPPDGALGIAESIWRLVYWHAAGPDPWRSFLRDIWPPAILALGWLLLAAIMWFHYRRLGRDLAVDLDALVETA